MGGMRLLSHFQQGVPYAPLRILSAMLRPQSISVLQQPAGLQRITGIPHALVVFGCIWHLFFAFFGFNAPIAVQRGTDMSTGQLYLEESEWFSNIFLPLNSKFSPRYTFLTCGSAARSSAEPDFRILPSKSK